MMRNLFMVCLLLVTAAVGGKAQGSFQNAAANLQVANSNLVIFTELNEPFTLLLNDQRLNQVPSLNIKVTGMAPGWYTIRLVFNNPSIPQAEMSLGIAPNRELTYAMVRGPQGQRNLMFVNEFTLGYNPIAPGQQFACSYNGPVQTNPDPTINWNIYHQNPPVTNTTQTTTTTVITTAPEPVVLGNEPVVVVVDDPLPGYNGPVGCQNVMAPEDFSNAKSSISSKTFSSSKMTLAKQITRANCLLSRQVREVMNLFDYETDRLNFAKFAYDYTYDQGNYFKVNDAFDFESSIRSLEEFLDGR